MTSSTQARARTLGFRTLVVLGGAALAVTALALPSKAAPAPTPGFTAAPSRLLDTVTGPGPIGAVKGINYVQVTDAVPTGATVELTITTFGTGNGYVVAYPDGTTLPNASDVNLVVDRTITTTVDETVPANGIIDVYVAGGPTELVVDQQGYFDSSTLVAPGPVKIADSRTAGAGFAKTGPQSGVVQITVPSADDPSGGVVALHVLAIPSGTGGGYVVAYAPGATPPVRTTVNYGSGLASSNLAFVQPVDGKVDLYVAGKAVDLVVDADGYAPTGSSLASAPVRIGDTRSGLGFPKAAFTGAKTLTIPSADVPAGTTAVVLNLTSISSTGNGILRAYSGAPPATTQLFFTKNVPAAMTVTVPVTATTTGAGTTYSVTVSVTGATSQVVVDLEGTIGAATSD